MAGKRIANIDVVANLDHGPFDRELLTLKAKTIATLDDISREKVKVSIDIDKNQLDRSLTEAKVALAEMKMAGNEAFDGRSIESWTRQLDKANIGLAKNKQSTSEYTTAIKILKVAEKERFEAEKKLSEEAEKRAEAAALAARGRSREAQVQGKGAIARIIRQGAVETTTAALVEKAGERVKRTKEREIKTRKENALAARTEAEVIVDGLSAIASAGESVAKKKPHGGAFTSPAGYKSETMAERKTREELARARDMRYGAGAGSGAGAGPSNPLGMFASGSLTELRTAASTREAQRRAQPSLNDRVGIGLVHGPQTNPMQPFSAMQSRNALDDRVGFNVRRNFAIRQIQKPLERTNAYAERIIDKGGNSPQMGPMNEMIRSYTASLRRLVATKEELTLATSRQGESEHWAMMSHRKSFTEEVNEAGLMPRFVRNREALNDAKRAGVRASQLDAQAEHLVSIGKHEAAAAVTKEASELRKSTSLKDADGRGLWKRTMLLKDHTKAAYDSHIAVQRFHKTWAVFTNSKNPMETFRKTMREPVRLGPFSATIKGIASAFTMLGPLVYSVGLTLISFIGIVGGAAVALGGLGVAAIGGFGQAFVGMRYAMKPAIDDFKVLTQTGDAYSKAVLKYGEGSKQAATAQAQMNHALKSASPLARQATTDFTASKIAFGKMTAPTRQAAGQMLGDTMKTVRQMAPRFARNTNLASGGLQRGVSSTLGKIRDNEAGGGGALSTMFRNSAKAMQPLITGAGNLFMAFSRIGASASRYFAPLANTFQKWSSHILAVTSNTGALNGKMSGLMADLKSVGRLLMASGRWAKDLLDTSRESGRGLADSLTGQFKKWDDAIKSPGGRKKLSQWFKESATLMKNFLNTLKPIISAVSEWARALSQVSGIAFGFSAALARIVGFALKLPIVNQALIGLAAAGAGLSVIARLKTSTVLMGMVTAAMAAVRALQALLLSSSAVTAALVTIEVAAPRAGLALTAMLTSTTLLTGVVGLAIVAVGLLVYGLMKLGSSGDAATQRLEARINRVGDALDAATVKSKEFQQSFQQKQSAQTDAQDAYDVAKANELATRGTEANKNAILDLNAAYEELDKAKKANHNTSGQITRDATKNQGVALQQGRDIRKDAKTYSVSNTEFTRNAAGRMVFKSGSSAGLPPTQSKEMGHLVAGDLDRSSAKLRQIRADYSKYVEDNKNNPLQPTGDTEKIITLINRELAARKANKAAQDQINTATAVAARAHLRMGTDNPQMLNQLSRVGATSQPLAKQIAVTYKNQGDVRAVAQTAADAMQRGVSAHAIGVQLKAHPGSAKDVDTAIAKMKPGKSVAVKTAANTDGATKDLADWVDAQNKDPKTITVKVKTKAAGAEGGAFASGGIFAAASGYTIDSAYKSASRRPTHRAAGKFSEPTLLVGEENRPEYVIATNPAYRSANIGYLASAAGDLGFNIVKAAASGTSPRKVLLNALLNEGIADDDPRGKPFVKKVKNKAVFLHYLEDKASSLSTMMSNDEKQNHPGMWKTHKSQRMSYLGQLAHFYRSARTVGSKANKAKIDGLIASTQGDLIDLKASVFGGGDQAQKDAQIAQLNAQLTSSKNALAINNAFTESVGGFMNSGGFVASGGPNRLARSGGGQTFIINTLHPGDSTTLSAIGNAAVAGFGYQGFSSSPRASV